MSPRLELNIVNAATATFECTFGRGCNGLCCQNGRPSLTPDEQVMVGGVLDRCLPHLRPEARRLIASDGFLSRRTKVGQPMMRVVDGWCVFFNGGCVLHKIGMEDGNFTQYKPYQCVIFPLEPLPDGRWYVRQHGYEDEEWTLFCLNPNNSTQKAVQSLGVEIDYAARKSVTSRSGTVGTIGPNGPDSAARELDSAVPG
jgi:hypothetical protein